MMNLKKYFLFICFGLCCLCSEAQNHPKQKQITIQFIHEANGKSISRGDSLYYNAFNEPYRIQKLKYYISNISFDQQADSTVFLIDAFATDQLQFNLSEGSYHAVEFLLGVDSALQTSGAQSGALDPLQGMYWTWNSGYVNFKLEGSSDSSGADLQRIEHHIGGYRSPFISMRKIKIEFPEPMQIFEQDEVVLQIVCDLDSYWNSVYPIRIQDHPLIMSSGELPAKIADNFTKLFRFRAIEYKKG